ncbi:MAG: glycolate oxidase iron-sulfur subunit [Betaproteobacteria bacterium RIFCSPLOWO2_02_FULL_66_14]|nr:MAG: glycolate oxidase iron-sulfur subunit [Betaproteobacteria bacterium RIFCSPLOWO2_02_FULL_66_14]
MQTRLADFIRGTAAGNDAEAILRKCVHCGFCTATCPTYQLLGDELDSPRGRIYLIKQALEGARVTARTRLHLDRCLTCRSCETTCPSGVQYGRLVDIGRKVVETLTRRSLPDRLVRAGLAFVLPRTALFGALLALGRLLRPMLPSFLRDKVPARIEPAGARPAARHPRRIVALAGCVQPALAPAVNAAAARVLDRVGISLVEAPGAGCCGALRFHLNDQDAGRADMRALIDHWWPLVERDEADGIVITASGCGATVEEYARILEHDPDYRHKAARISLLARDLSEVIAAESPALERLLGERRAKRAPLRVAFQSPCSLQHGLKIRGVVEDLLVKSGHELTTVPDAHLCCGSAGVYSILQSDLSMQLRARKLAALAGDSPQVIATANVGCLAHLQAGTATPVRHWIQLLDDALRE